MNYVGFDGGKYLLNQELSYNLTKKMFLVTTICILNLIGVLVFYSILFTDLAVLQMFNNVCKCIISFQLKYKNES